MNPNDPNADTADALRARIRSQSKTVADHIAADPEAQGFIDNWTTPEPIPPDDQREAQGRADRHR